MINKIKSQIIHLVDIIDYYNYSYGIVLNFLKLFFLIKLFLFLFKFYDKRFEIYDYFYSFVEFDD
jgi:hypothetical protein